jgi:hypothetical protein
MTQQAFTNLASPVPICKLPKRDAPGTLADAELHFADGPLTGLKPIGFAILERDRATQTGVDLLVVSAERELTRIASQYAGA